MTRIYFSATAETRWAQLFSSYGMEEQFDKSFPYGGQLGNDTMRLAPCDAVFVVRQATVVTVLTKAMAQANMSRALGTRFDPEIPRRRGPQRVLPLTEEDQQRILTLVHAHVQSGRTGKGSKRARNHALAQLGYDIEGEAGRYYRAQLDRLILEQQQAKWQQRHR